MLEILYYNILEFYNFSSKIAEFLSHIKYNSTKILSTTGYNFFSWETKQLKELLYCNKKFDFCINFNKL